VGAIIPTTLNQDSGFGGKQLLILIVALFTLGLVFVPAYAWRKMAQTSATITAASQSKPVPQQQVSV